VRENGQNICGMYYAFTSIVVDPENQYYSSMGANAIVLKELNTLLVAGCKKQVKTSAHPTADYIVPFTNHRMFV